MRKLLWFAIGFSTSMFLALQIFPSLVSIAWGFLFVSLSIALVVLWDTPLFKRIALVFLGAALGLSWLWVYNTVWLRPISLLQDHSVKTVVTASEYTRDLNYGSSVDGTIVLEEGSYKIRVYLDDHLDLAPGDRIYGNFRLRYTADFQEQEFTNSAG